MLYKDLLKEVRANLKEVRKEFKQAKNTTKTYNEFLLEHKKLRDLSRSKKFFLGKKKDKPYLEWLNEELKTFLEQPNIRKADRVCRHKKSIDNLMNNYDLSREDAEKLTVFLNDDTIKRALERGILSSEQVAEAEQNGVSLRRFIKAINETDKLEKDGKINFDEMSNTEVDEYWRKAFKISSGKWRT